MKRMIRWLALGLAATVGTIGLAGCGETTDSGEKSRNRLATGCVATRTMTDTDQTRIKATVAAVVVDEGGLIQECTLDELAFTVRLADGTPLTVDDLTTKGDRGEDYLPSDADTRGSHRLSASWRQQADAFCRYAVGRTAGEISGLAATDGKSDRIPGCDLVITDFIEAVRKASDAAVAQKTGIGDTLALSLTGVKNAEATDDTPQYDVEIAAVTMDENGTLTGCYVDTLQAKMTVENGMFTSTSGAIETKRDKGDSYGLKRASAIGKEWFEQANAFGTYAVGKTAGSLNAVRPDGGGKVDAIAGCTVAVTGMLKNVVKATEKIG